MTVFSIIVAAALPWVVLFIPGIFLPRFEVLNLARVFLGSISLWIVLAFLVFWLGLPVIFVPILVGIISLLLWWWHRPSFVGNFTADILPLLFVGLSYLLFSIAFWQNHGALPTGDSQKAIYWGEMAVAQHQLPDYQESLRLLNRDPVDFYTPGLHAITGALMHYSPEPLSTIGFFSIAVAVVVGLLAIGLTQLLVPHAPRWVPYLAGVLVLTNLRFLRYIAEPGYHYQNAVGELLLFGLLFFSFSIMRAWQWHNAALGLLAFIALLLSHQFSAFLSAFILLPVAIALAVRHLQGHWQALSPMRLLMLLVSIIVCLGAGFALGLHEKIPHIFTTTPHLRNLVVPVSQYPRFLGYLLVFLGIPGAALLLIPPRRRGLTIVFVAVTAIILVLSYGPWFGIDIPPARTLWYAIVPLACLSSAALFLWYRHERGQLGIQLPWLSVILIVIIVGAATVGTALTPRHSARTNSTLTAGQLSLIDELRGVGSDPAILIDDYNRRASSWFILTGRPTFTRLSADIQTQMAEARQTATRRQLYFNHLAYEKIYALGSLPEITQLLTAHKVAYLAGVTGSSADAFSHNPALTVATQADDLTIFSATDFSRSSLPAEVTPWLLKGSTLANDIGDNEDTFEHLMASLRSTRLSPPESRDSVTSRSTSAPVIPLRFNVGDYALILWAQEGRDVPDTAVEFYWQVVNAPTGLTLRTSTGVSSPLPATGHAMIRLERESVPIDDDGFITLYIDNPTAQEVAIDLFALGLARVP